MKPLFLQVRWMLYRSRVYGAISRVAQILAVLFLKLTTHYGSKSHALITGAQSKLFSPAMKPWITKIEGEARFYASGIVEVTAASNVTFEYDGLAHWKLPFTMRPGRILVVTGHGSISARSESSPWPGAVEVL